MGSAGTGKRIGVKHSSTQDGDSFIRDFSLHFKCEVCLKKREQGHTFIHTASLIHFRDFSRILM